MCAGVQNVKLSMESRQQNQTWDLKSNSASNFELGISKKSDKMKILVMMCLASAIASVTQSDPQPKGKPWSKNSKKLLTFKKTFVYAEVSFDALALLSLS